MPNWCWNNLSITPSESDESGEGIKNLRAKLLFMVEDMKQNPKLWGGAFDYLVGREDDWDEVDGWYEHNIRVYGSKWQKSAEDFMEALEDDGEFISMGFQSAWSPVVGFTKLLSKEYRLHIEHTYDETGEWYAGKLVVDNGEVLEDFCYPYYEGIYNIDKDLFWHEIDSNMECWFDDGIDEAKESYQNTMKEISKFLTFDDLDEFKTKFKESAKIQKKKQKMEEKSGMDCWESYLVAGQKLKFIGWNDGQYRFYTEDNQLVQKKRLPKDIKPVEK